MNLQFSFAKPSIYNAKMLEMHEKNSFDDPIFFVFLCPHGKHACGSFITDEGDTMRFILNINKHWAFHMQVLLVTGGYNDYEIVHRGTGSRGSLETNWSAAL